MFTDDCLLIIKYYKGNRENEVISCNRHFYFLILKELQYHDDLISFCPCLAIIVSHYNEQEANHFLMHLF